MKYSYLKEWTQDMADYQSGIENIILFPELLMLQTKDKNALFIVLSKRDAFMFRKDNFPMPQGGKLFWQIIVNSQLTHISLVENDRIIYLKLHYKDIYQQNKIYYIIAELMPPQPNAILVDADMKIIDAVYKYGYSDNPQRQILPGLIYTPPKTSFQPILEAVKIPFPDGSSTCNDYFSNLYYGKFKQEEEAENRHKLHSALQKELQKTLKKQKMLQKDLENAEKADFWLACAEGLKPNLHNIKSGMQSFKTINYLDPNLQEIEIPLLPNKNPQENLHLYLKKYHKAKNGLKIIRENLAKIDTEIAKIQELIVKADKGELPETIILTSHQRKNLVPETIFADKLLKFTIADEFQIIVGRRAKENDYITTKLARPYDYWFHSRIYHGAHILLKCLKKTEPSPQLIELCCNLAAWYSKAKFSANVPVDYTQIRYVRKPHKSPPGFVTYTNFKSVYAKPMSLREIKDILS
ncbi:MAG: NFACT RNA binding domain-containing protein [Candidatus Cloacimonas sp.]